MPSKLKPVLFLGIAGAVVAAVRKRSAKAGQLATRDVGHAHRGQVVARHHRFTRQQFHAQGLQLAEGGGKPENRACVTGPAAGGLDQFFQGEHLRAREFEGLADALCLMHRTAVARSRRGSLNRSQGKGRRNPASGHARRPRQPERRPDH